MNESSFYSRLEKLRLEIIPFLVMNYSKTDDCAYSFRFASVYHVELDTYHLPDYEPGGESGEDAYLESAKKNFKVWRGYYIKEQD